MSYLPYSDESYLPQVVKARALGQRKRAQKTINGKKWSVTALPDGTARGSSSTKLRKKSVGVRYGASR